MKNILFQLAAMVYPAHCCGCNELIEYAASFCSGCQKNIKRIENPCTACGKPKDKCDCFRMGFRLYMVSPFSYSGAVRSAIQRFKFNGEKKISKTFAPEMAKSVDLHFSDIEFDFVTCVPQTRRKRRQRGYNQSALLAQRCAVLIGVRYRSVLVKTRHTKDQHTLTGKERLRNLKGAFAVNPKVDVSGKTILLCDDVKTTGATLYECRKTLIKAGAKAVYCVTAAVTLEE